MKVLVVDDNAAARDILVATLDVEGYTVFTAADGTFAQVYALRRAQPLGVAVVMEATHLCKAMRGVEKQNSVTVTSAMRGLFHQDARTRQEFLKLIGK